MEGVEELRHVRVDDVEAAEAEKDEVLAQKHGLEPGVDDG